MPCDYKKYPANWKTEIRPAIMRRAKNRCEKCNVEHNSIILRGHVDDREVYQDDDGIIYDAHTSERIGAAYIGDVDSTGKRDFIKVVLTVAHFDHDLNNNSYDPSDKNAADNNLFAWCQRCHNRHDLIHRLNTREKNKGQIKLV